MAATNLARKDRKMTQHTSAGKEQLLDAAEELFAREGVGAVSNRRIIEHAGAANHSAIAYHFGGRDELIEALLDRHRDELAPRRAEHETKLSDEPTIYELVRYRLLPMVELFAARPTPSWRAQFLAEARSSPSASDVFTGVVNRFAVEEVYLRGAHDASTVSREVIGARATLVGHMVLGVCAQQERQTNEGTNRGSWLDTGFFLIDAAAGMLQAPSTYHGAVPRGAPPSLL